MEDNECLAPFGQKDALKFVIYRVIVTSQEYAPLHYVNEKTAEANCYPRPVFMTHEVADFIRQNCRCEFCKKPVPKTLERCDCELNTGYIIKVEYLESLFDSVLRPLLDAMYYIQKETRKSFNRNRRIKAAGTHTQSEIDALLEIQENRCFYCAEIICEDGKQSFQKDHYLALINEGKNTVDNIVLACRYCNNRKGVNNAEDFIRVRSKELDPTMRGKAKSIRAKTRAYKRKLG